MARNNLAFQQLGRDAEPAEFDALDPDKPVSKSSRFGDAQWRFFSKTAGRRAVVLNWSHLPPRGSKLDEAEWLDLVRTCKFFVQTCLTVSVRGRPLKVDSLPNIHGCLSYLMRWMASTDHATFEELDEDVVEAFLEYLERDKAGISHASFSGYVDVLCRIHELQDLLALVPGGRMPAHPIGFRAAHGRAAEMADPARERRPAIPDEVWLATVNAATIWLDRHAEQVVALGQALADYESAEGAFPLGIQRSML